MRSRFRNILAGAIFCALLVCISPAQTTLPARAAWPDVVAALADALVDAPDENLSQLLSDDVLIRRFDRIDYDERISLHDTAVGMTVVSTHGYLGVPNSIATDLAMDFSNSTALPDEIKAQMTLSNETEIKRANITAAQWMTSTLAPARAQPVGLIVLYGRAAADAADAPSLVFVLLKAESTADQQIRITHIIYGDIRQVMR